MLISAICVTETYAQVRGHTPVHTLKLSHAYMQQVLFGSLVNGRTGFNGAQMDIRKKCTLNDS